MSDGAVLADVRPALASDRRLWKMAKSFLKNLIVERPKVRAMPAATVSAVPSGMSVSGAI
jgi:hypothetical protein